MLIVGCLWRHAVALMRLAVHALLASSTPKWASTVPALIAAIAVLMVLRKTLIIVSPHVIEHWTFAAVWMVTYLVHVVRGIVIAIWAIAAIRICTVLSAALPVALLLLQH